MQLVIGSVFALWFTVSVLNQFGFKWINRVRERDLFSLIPYFTFFAPNPGQSDYHVVYRDKRANGELTPWSELETTEPRRVYSWLWNPEKRSKKVVSDVVASIVQLIPECKSEDALMLSLPYLTVLNAVTQLEVSPGATHRQFVLLETYGFFPTASPRVLLKSDFHQLPGR